MAKIDVSKIEGYADMSAEDKLKALEAYDLDDHATELAKLKEEMSKRNSEVANLKEQLKAKMSDEEKAKTEKEEELNKLREEVANLQKDKSINEYKASLLALGYSDELATETAKAQVEGDTLKVLENQKKFIESHDKNLKAELMKGTPTPPAGAGGETMTLEKFRKLSHKERLAFSQEHPDEYKQLYGGN